MIHQRLYEWSINKLMKINGAFPYYLLPPYEGQSAGEAWRAEILTGNGH